MSESEQFSKEQIIATCAEAEGFDLFANILLGDSYEYSFPEIHVSYWKLITDSAKRGDSTNVWKGINDLAELLDKHFEEKYGLGLPRGFAKTTLIKLFCAWTFLYTDWKFILVVSAAKDLACNVVGDIAAFLDRPEVLAIWGNWRYQLEIDRNDLKKFTFNGKVRILAALGAESSIRGLNLGNERPEIIVCEDAQTKDSALSPELNSKFIKWYIGTLHKARSYKRSLIIYIGNIYNERCLLNQLRANPQYITFIAPAILANRETIWPEFRTYESLIQEFRSDIALGHPEEFIAEVMNDPLAETVSHFDCALVPPYAFPLELEPDGAFLTIDPATGKESGNATAITLHHVIEGRCCIRKIYFGQWNDEATVREGLKIAIGEGCSHIFVEAVAYQASLANYFYRVISGKNIAIRVVPITPMGIPKNARIKNFLKRIVADKTKKLPIPQNYIHPEARPHVFFQAVRFNPVKRDNEDDILDSAAYGDIALQTHWHEITYNAKTYDGKLNGAVVHDTSETACF